jgi:phenylpropionate dioxygenase-like ring-hydroxylating dioxygenase large terminal subunit
MPNPLPALLDAQQPDYCLEQPFYADAGIFESDIERIFGRRWLLVDHVARIPAKGAWFLYEIAGESIIVVRDAGERVNAFFNVCRHRGSRVCLESAGHAARLVCPYHAWTYGLDGRLVGARKMSKDFDKQQFGLRPCAVQVVAGLIFINLSGAAAMDFTAARTAITPYLDLHGIAEAKIAARAMYGVAANWKLVMENFLECYHCLPAHPEYCSVNSIVKLIGDGSERASMEYLQAWERWKAASDPDLLAREVALSGPADQGLDPQHPYSIPHAHGAAHSGPVYAAMRTLIGEGYQTMSEAGRPVAPLMGRFRRYDGGKTSVSVDYFGRMTAANDYAVLFKFIPVSAQFTNFEIIWLVRGDAVAGQDYDLPRLQWLWHVTTTQDKTLAENNQRGVNSRAYRPGPYSDLEDTPARFVRWYLQQIDPRLGGA